MRINKTKTTARMQAGGGGWMVVVVVVVGRLAQSIVGS